MENGLWDNQSFIDNAHASGCEWEAARVALALAKGGDA